MYWEIAPVRKYIQKWLREIVLYATISLNDAHVSIWRKHKNTDVCVIRTRRSIWQNLQDILLSGKKHYRRYC